MISNEYNYDMIDQTNIASTINGHISVRSSSLGTEVIVDGFQQSGPKMFSVWRQGVIGLLSQQFRPENILILGVGGGSVISVITNRWRKAKIIGVDIDDRMLEIARTHFNHAMTLNLELVHSDAFQYIQSLSEAQRKLSKPTFDLTFVDCYIGPNVPDNLHSKETVAQLSKLSKIILFNRLNTQLERPATNDFTSMVEKEFAANYQDQQHNRIIKIGTE